MSLALFFPSVIVSKVNGLRTSDVTFKSVRVDWNRNPEPFILGYRVLVHNFSLIKFSSWNETYARIGGLRSNTTYSISVLPLHGLTDEENLSEIVGRVIITTKQELGKQFERDLKCYKC